MDHLTSAPFVYLPVFMQSANDGTVVNGNVLRFTNFDRYSLTNVEPGSAKLWVHLVSVHFVVLVTLWVSPGLHCKLRCPKCHRWTGKAVARGPGLRLPYVPYM